MKLTKIIKLFLILISPYCLFSQSYHTVSFTGNINDFNNDNTERKYAGNNTRYFITFDEKYIYETKNIISYDISSRGINLPCSMNLTKSQIDEYSEELIKFIILRKIYFI